MFYCEINIIPMGILLCVYIILPLRPGHVQWTKVNPFLMNPIKAHPSSFLLYVEAQVS